MSNTICSDVSHGGIEARIDLPREISARTIVIRLHHPDGQPMRSVTVPGEVHMDFDARQETVTLAPAGETIAVRAAY
ncbi:MAG: hypothetical protein AB1486_04855 [Planctomycetota bacterium]